MDAQEKLRRFLQLQSKYPGFIVDRSETIEIDLGASPANGDPLPFPNENRIKNRYIYGIELVTSDNQAKSPNGIDVLSQTEATGITVTLTEGSNQFQKDRAAMLYNRFPNGGFIPFLQPRIINWESSFITIVDDTVVAASHAAVFVVYMFQQAQMAPRLKAR